MIEEGNAGNENGGQLWTDSAEAGYDTSVSFPSSFCPSGSSSLYAAFIEGLLLDLVFQVRDRSYWLCNKMLVLTKRRLRLSWTVFRSRCTCF